MLHNFVLKTLSALLRSNLSLRSITLVLRDILHEGYLGVMEDVIGEMHAQLILHNETLEAGVHFKGVSTFNSSSSSQAVCAKD